MKSCKNVAAIVAGAVLVLAFLSGCKSEADADPAARQGGAQVNQTVDERELHDVDLYTVEPQTLSDRVKVSGELREVNRAVVKARISGTVTEVLVRPGQAVRKDDVLLRFDRGDISASLRSAEANLSVAQADRLQAEQKLQRSRQLRERQVESPAALESAENAAASAQARVAANEAQVETARNGLAHADVRAPIDGTVASRSVEIGETVANGSALIVIVDSRAFEAEVLIATRDVARLRIGQKAKLSVDGLPNQTLAAEIKLISPTANAGTRFVPVFLHIDETDASLFGGMFASGWITVREKPKSIAIPETALREGAGGKSFVLAVIDGRLQRRNVTPGDVWSGQIEITEGLAPGDVVLRTPMAGVVEGARVSSPRGTKG
jgi:RND family efflux transporter MFP subunit